MGPIDLLKAEHVGIRELKANLSAYMHSKKPIITTDRGEPVKVLVTYQDMVALLELLGDLSDKRMAEAVRGGRASIKRGAVGIAARESLDKLR